MYASVHTFDHLHAAEEARFVRELEYRRIALERGSEQPSMFVRASHRVGRLLRRGQRAATPRLSPSR